MNAQLNKRQIKKQNIAKSCCALFAEHGFTNTSVSDIAKNAKIGKGTIYEYFSNKEDIVCELMDCLQRDYDDKLKENLNQCDGAKQKIMVLFSIFCSDNEILVSKRKIYKQFLIACLTNPSDSLISYNVKLRDKYTSFLSEIHPDINSKKIYDSIIGFFIASESLNAYQLEQNIEYFIDREIK